MCVCVCVGVGVCVWGCERVLSLSTCVSPSREHVRKPKHACVSPSREPEPVCVSVI